MDDLELDKALARADKAKLVPIVGTNNLPADRAKR
jgi:hypothetical protein